MNTHRHTKNRYEEENLNENTLLLSFKVKASPQLAMNVSGRLVERALVARFHLFIIIVSSPEWISFVTMIDGRG